MRFSITIIVLPIVLAIPFNDPDPKPCDVDRCTDVINSGGCWHIARSKEALLACAPEGDIQVFEFR